MRHQSDTVRQRLYGCRYNDKQDKGKRHGPSCRVCKEKHEHHAEAGPQQRRQSRVLRQVRAPSALKLLSQQRHRVRSIRFRCSAVLSSEHSVGCSLRLVLTASHSKAHFAVGLTFRFCSLSFVSTKPRFHRMFFQSEAQDVEIPAACFGFRRKHNDKDIVGGSTGRNIFIWFFVIVNQGLIEHGCKIVWDTIFSWCASRLTRLQVRDNFCKPTGAFL